jgi:hypothetical protein
MIPPRSEFISYFINMASSDTNQRFPDVSTVHVCSEFLLDCFQRIVLNSLRLIPEKTLNHLPIVFDPVPSVYVR